MDLKEVRKRLLTAARRSKHSYTDEALDYAIQTMLRDMELTDVHSLVDTTSLSLTANDPEFDLSSLNTTNSEFFRPEKVYRCEFAFTDKGAWSGSSVSYLKGIDLVANDNKFYVATEDHTSTASNGPDSSAGDWRRVLSKRGHEIELIKYEVVQRFLVDSRGVPLQSAFVLADNNPVSSPDQPRVLGFQTQDRAYVWPVPDVAYKVVFTIKTEVAGWDAGTEASVDIDVPEKFLIPAINSGGIFYLDRDRNDSVFLRQDFERLKNKIQGALYVQRGVGYKDERCFSDDLSIFPYRGRRF